VTRILTAEDRGPLAGSPLAGYLLTTPEPPELDDHGCFSRDSAADVERMLLESMDSAIDGFEVPPLPSVRTQPDDKWRLASGMQKAIRYGMPEAAMAAANGLYTIDRTYALRRLGVILVEDVMAGDPILVARTLAILGHNDWRREVGERRLVIWIAKKAAEAPKDRSAVELLVMVENDQLVDIDALVEMTDDRLTSLIRDRGHRLVDRVAAAQILVGPRYAADRMPKTGSRTPTALFRLMVEMATTRWGLYVGAQTASRIRESMFLTLPIIDGWMRQHTVSVVNGPDFPKPMVGDVLGAAYDQYTRLGLRAIDRFAREVPEVARYIQAVRPGKRRYAARTGVFLAEGGSLGRRAVYGDESALVHRWVRSPERMWWMPRDLAAEYLPMVRRNLGYLNQFRAELVNAEAVYLEGV
jgi:hypothetical protein